MSKPQAPQPPNPQATAAASTSTNVATGVANAFLGNVNQITPEGELRYDATGNYDWTDPYTGLRLNIPTFTATQIRSPDQQAIADQQRAAQFNLASMGNQVSGSLGQLLSTPFNLNSAPGAGNINTLTSAGDPMRNIGYTGPGQQFSFGQAGDITRDYGPADNYSADRLRVEEALYGRLNPQLQRERSNVEQRLSDQGIRYGSQAYTSAMDDYSRQANDARLAVTGIGGQEQQRLNDMAAQRAGFQNAAQQQAYTQELGRGQFANAAQRDAFSQQALNAQFYNAGQAQDFSQNQSVFNAQNVLRNQSIAEQYALRNQPINEISTLLNGGQLSNPSFLNTPSNQIATTDTAGLINQNFNQQMGIYNAQSQQYNNLMGGIFGMMGGLMRASDRRLKEDIKQIGTAYVGDPDKDETNKISGVFGADPDKDERALPIYSYKYKGDPTHTPQTGPMAQDLEKLDKTAVRTKKGVKFIDQTRLASILKVA